MGTFRFIHCADLHIDSPLRGLEADPDAPADHIRAATRTAFTRLVDHALEQAVDFVIAAGDLYDGEWPDWRTGQFLVRQVARLSAAGIPFIAIRGNHDAQSVISRELRFAAPAVELSHRKPQTVRLDHLGVAIHGQGFASPAVRDDLRRDYPPPEPGLFNIGVLHTNVDGRQGHENYAPCALADLRAHGYDYWALGHVHTRAELSADPWIVYPGNLQGRSVRETGPRGAYIVSVSDNQVVAPPVFVAFDTVRWASLAVDISGAADEDAALALVRARLAAAVAEADGRLLAARLRLTGTAEAALGRNPADLRERLRGEIAGLDQVWIESLSVEVAPAKPGEAVPEPLLAAIGAVGAAELGADAAAYCQALLDRLPGLRDELALLEGTEALLTLDRARSLPPDLLDRAKALLLAQLGDA